ncbi:MAG: DUF1840 domain-containing protein [Pseudomonadota bacterium]|nr:DUF1840 domain-containing protein [Gammaproteobacteria bacterium]MDQ3580460.1 DUF1840 domain-containing protein [Pseudomonadota bacterium]
MLVTFRSKASADVVMFGDMAITLLTLMGHGGTVPGAILAEDVDAALSKLKQAVEAREAVAAGDEYSPIREDDSDELPVSLANRALPLIELLTAAAAAKCNVMWDK